MNYNSMNQSLSNYLEKLYDKLIKDSKRISDFQVYHKSFQLEAGRLSNYSFAIKEEIKNELTQTDYYKGLGTEEKNNLVSKLDRIHIQFAIPHYELKEEECVDVVTIETNSNPVSRGSQKSSGALNIGTAVGGIVGLGIGIVVTKSIPLILLGTVSGAVVGGIVGHSIRANHSVSQPTQHRQENRPQMAPKTYGKVNSRKVEKVIQVRKANIMKLFQQYLQQLFEVCQPILK
ncbi:hypothetical protein V7182_22265 [Neobacillus drentensis]|uniref:hypothetical protein n=1 Tax=Neobacillus drentensis TaxID=220684 RepID=UPI002FFF9689